MSIINFVILSLADIAYLSYVKHVYFDTVITLMSAVKYKECEWTNSQRLTRVEDFDISAGFALNLIVVRLINSLPYQSSVLHAQGMV